MNSVGRLMPSPHGPSPAPCVPQGVAFLAAVWHQWRGLGLTDANISSALRRLSHGAPHKTQGGPWAAPPVSCLWVPAHTLAVLHIPVLCGMPSVHHSCITAAGRRSESPCSIAPPAAQPPPYRLVLWPQGIFAGDAPTAWSTLQGPSRARVQHFTQAVLALLRLVGRGA